MYTPRIQFIAPPLEITLSDNTNLHLCLELTPQYSLVESTKDRDNTHRVRCWHLHLSIPRWQYCSMHLSAWILLVIYSSPGVVAFYPYKAEEKTGPVTKEDDKTARRSSIGKLLVESGLSPREGNVEVPTLNIRRRAPRVSSIRLPLSIPLS